MWCKSNPASYNYLHIYLGLLHGYFVPLMHVVSAFVLSMNHLIRGFPPIQPLDFLGTPNRRLVRDASAFSILSFLVAIVPYTYFSD